MRYITKSNHEYTKTKQEKSNERVKFYYKKTPRIDVKPDSGDGRLEGEEHHFRFTQVKKTETNSRNASANILILGDPGCFCFLGGLTQIWTQSWPPK